MKGKIYEQHICSNCLQMFENNESYHSKDEKTTFDKTIKAWSKDKYYPLGMSDSQQEPYFSWSKCDVCNGLTGMRYDYSFIKQ